MAKARHKRAQSKPKLFISEEQAVRIAANESRLHWRACPEMLRASRLPYYSGTARGIATAEAIGFLMQNRGHFELPGAQ